MKDKVLRYLGLAARGRMLATGYNTCIFMMNKGKVRLVILASDLAEGSMEKMTSAAEKGGVAWRIHGTKEELSHITGKENSGIFGITDQNLSKAILEELDNVRSV